ncbi:MAG: long-chain fatty acid--CoA ligase [Desulfarculaceae bacterium]|jgi:fatty-acyl-CoA synthase
MIKSMNTAWWVERWSELHPQKPALIFEGRTITYLELHKRASRTSCWLQELGIEKGDRVAVLLDNCPEFIEVFLACSRLGAVCVPMNFRLAPRELDYILGHCRPRALVFAGHFAPKLTSLDLEHRRPSLVAVAVGQPTAQVNGHVLDYQQGVESHEGQVPFLGRTLGPADADEPQVIMYTSGTTGQPKGAVLTHCKTFFNCLNADIFFKMAADDVMLIVLPLFHSGGLFIQASPGLFMGVTLLLHRRFDPQAIYRDIENYKVTKFLGVPTVYRALLQIEPSQRGDLSSLKACAIGGEKVTPELLAECAQAGFAARQIMGQTETSILLWCSEEEALERPGTVGRPVFHAEVRVVDKQGQPVKPHEVGEIVVRGPVLMKEYWHDPQQTEQTLRGGWLHTGDLARVDDDGYYYLVDRAKDMYISGGENVYPAEVERALRAHPQVEEAAVIGMSHEKWGEVGHAYVICSNGASLGEEELITYCQSCMASYKVPKKVTFCKDFPRTPLGKVRKFLLTQEPGSGEDN